MTRVVLVVPDAGPLISLGKADALSHLLSLELPIYVVDQVLFEVTRDERHDDARRIADFVAGHQSTIHVFETEVGKDAASRRVAGETARQKGRGEAAIAEFLARLDEVAQPDDAVLLVYEDSDVRKSRFVLPDNVHVVSTKALLVGMERRGLIPSVDAIWKAITDNGRRPSEDSVDVPASTPRGPSSC
ncbi:hypothetical protein [Azospirillum sp. sgz302134]